MIIGQLWNHAYFIIWFSFNINFRFSVKCCSRAQKVIYHKYVKYICSMETVQQNGRFPLFSSKFHTNIYSILFGYMVLWMNQSWQCSCTVRPPVTDEIVPYWMLTVPLLTRWIINRKTTFKKSCVYLMLL